MSNTSWQRALVLFTGLVACDAGPTSTSSAPTTAQAQPSVTTGAPVAPPQARALPAYAHPACKLAQQAPAPRQYSFDEATAHRGGLESPERTISGFVVGAADKLLLDHGRAYPTAVHSVATGKHETLAFGDFVEVRVFGTPTADDDGAGNRGIGFSDTAISIQKVSPPEGARPVMFAARGLVIYHDGTAALNSGHEPATVSDDDVRVLMQALAEANASATTERHFGDYLLHCANFEVFNKQPELDEVSELVDRMIANAADTFEYRLHYTERYDRVVDWNLEGTSLADRSFGGDVVVPDRLLRSMARGSSVDRMPSGIALFREDGTLYHVEKTGPEKPRRLRKTLKAYPCGEGTHMCRKVPAGVKLDGATQGAVVTPAQIAQMRFEPVRTPEKSGYGVLVDGEVGFGGLYLTRSAPDAPPKTHELVTGERSKLQQWPKGWTELAEFHYEKHIGNDTNDQDHPLRKPYPKKLAKMLAAGPLFTQDGEVWEVVDRCPPGSDYKTLGPQIRGCRNGYWLSLYVKHRTTRPWPRELGAPPAPAETVAIAPDEYRRHQQAYDRLRLFRGSFVWKQKMFGVTVKPAP